MCVSDLGSSQARVLKLLSHGTYSLFISDKYWKKQGNWFVQLLTGP